jgi:hypothetical protein
LKALLKKEAKKGSIGLETISKEEAKKKKKKKRTESTHDRKDKSASELQLTNPKPDLTNTT